MLRLCLLFPLLFSSNFNKQEAYLQLKKNVVLKQQELSRHYHQSKIKDSIYRKSSEYLLGLVSDSMSFYWENTDWEFYGESETPGSGSIACGYFVTTVLRDAGFKLDRVALAKTWSEKMIRSMVKPQFVKRYSPYRHNKFIEEIRMQGDGLYLIGLDFHTGFIICQNKEVYFLHSNYTSRVMKEIALGSPVLARNKYAVAGKISADTALLGLWLRNGKADRLNPDY